MGAYCGAMVGLNSMSSMLYGAITGCILSIEVLRKSFVLWDSDDWAIVFFIHFVETDSIILNERIERLSSHSTVCRNGKSMLKIPNKRFTGKNIVDTLWNGPTCSICLQDFQKGEMVGSLPPCRHIFHPSCISQWFIGHSSCLLCRKTPFMLEKVDCT
uniref:RING-type domain-containing protein n=1 Tax=Populus trichocarpa TaxID=3694 RepID=B9GQ79_POPTR